MATVGKRVRGESLDRAESLAPVNLNKLSPCPPKLSFSEPGILSEALKSSKAAFLTFRELVTPWDVLFNHQPSLLLFLPIGGGSNLQLNN